MKVWKYACLYPKVWWMQNNLSEYNCFSEFPILETVSYNFMNDPMAKHTHTTSKKLLKHHHVLNKSAIKILLVISEVGLENGVSTLAYSCSKFRDVFFHWCMGKKAFYLTSVNTRGSHMGIRNSLAQRHVSSGLPPFGYFSTVGRHLKRTVSKHQNQRFAAAEIAFPVVFWGRKFVKLWTHLEAI